MFCQNCNKNISLASASPYFSLNGHILCNDCREVMNTVPFTLDGQQEGGICGYSEAEKEALRLKIKKVAGEAIQRTIINAFNDDVSLMSASNIAELISWEVIRVIKCENVQTQYKGETS